jgi:prephenate dehydrogenase
MKIAIVGTGAMGRWLANFAKKNLGETTIVSRDFAKAKRVAKELGVQAKTREKAAAEADVVLVAVPISVTPELVKSLANLMKSGALLADIASVKSEVVEAMRKINADVELVSLHPLFGPGATGVKGKDLVAVPVRPGKRYAELKQRLIKLGARVTEMGAEEHDRLMAIVQCMTHFVLISYLAALKSMGAEHVKLVGTPMFATLQDFAKAISAGSSELYSELQVFNKHAKLARSALIDACCSLDEAFKAKDVEAVRKILEYAQEMWGKTETQAAYKKLYAKFEGKK